MSSKRRRRKPEQIVKLLQEGEAMLAAGKSLGEVFQKLEVKESTWQRWKRQYGGVRRSITFRRPVTYRSVGHVEL